MGVVFVFGSNLAGRHGKGAALEARQKWGAIYGKGTGRWGDSYAVPTKDEKLRALPLDVIAEHVHAFLQHARALPNDSFLVTAIGCGLAGYRPEQIAPMFAGAPENVFLSAKLTPPEPAKPADSGEVGELIEELRELATQWSSFGHAGRAKWLTRSADTLARLAARLELTDEFPDGPDGIECRNDTIKLLDERIAHLVEDKRINTITERDLIAERDAALEEVARLEAERARLHALAKANNSYAKLLVAEVARMREALEPFAACCEQIADDESSEEWAKFRLLIGDFRRASAALNHTGGEG